MRELTGGSVDYYTVTVDRPEDKSAPYRAQCVDLIEALKLSYAEGNVLKAIWRRAALRNGCGKPGSTALYESEKAEYFANRMAAADRYLTKKAKP